MVSGQEHKLAAIMFTDMVGYRALSQMDELLAMELLEEHRRALRPVFALYGGAEIRTIGDGILMEFENALLAVRAALDGQEALRNHNQTQPLEKQVHVRIGIHFAEVSRQDGDVLGDAVSIAARIEPFAAPGCICISEEVHRRVAGAISIPMVRLGRGELENVRERIILYELIPPGVSTSPLRERMRFLSRRRSVQAAGIAAAILATGLASYAMALTSVRPGCSGTERNLEEIWDEPAKAAIQRAFAATSRPGAGQAWEAVHRQMDAFASSWTAMNADACVATEEPGQPEEALALRVACLDAKRAELGALASLLAKADGDVVDRAAGAAYALGGVEACGDVDFLSAEVKPPRSPELRQAVDQARRELAEVKALALAGKWNDGLARAEPLLARVRGLGYLPIEAEALAALGRLHAVAGHWPQAQKLLVEAAGTAERGHHDEVRAAAATWLVSVVGLGLGRPEEGLVWADVAGPVIERAGMRRDLEGMLADAVGGIHCAQGRYDLAVQDAERAWKTNAGYLGGDHPSVAVSLGNLGKALLAQGRAREAMERFEKSAALAEKALGGEHPQLAAALAGLGASELALGAPARAVEPLERALQLYGKRPASRAELARVRFDLARALEGSRGDPARARALAAEAVEDFRAEEGHGEDAASVQKWLASLGAPQARAAP